MSSYAGIYATDGKLIRTVTLQQDPERSTTWIPTEPIKVDAGQWIVTHLEVEDVGTFERVIGPGPREFELHNLPQPTMPKNQQATISMIPLPNRWAAFTDDELAVLMDAVWRLEPARAARPVSHPMQLLEGLGHEVEAELERRKA